MSSDREHESELLEASFRISEDAVNAAREVITVLTCEDFQSLSADQIATARSAAFTLFAYLLACQRTAGHLQGVRQLEYTSNLSDAMTCLEQWNELNPTLAGDAYGGLEFVELMYQEDWNKQPESAPGFADLILVSRFVHQAIPRFRPRR